jgi:hypothetical protein
MEVWAAHTVRDARALAQVLATCQTNATASGIYGSIVMDATSLLQLMALNRPHHRMFQSQAELNGARSN